MRRLWSADELGECWTLFPGDLALVAMRAAAPRDGAPAPPIPPEIQAELVHDMLDRQYRSLLDEPVPMLGNLTPRAAARSARGQRNLATWLKHLENRSSQAPTRTIRWRPTTSHGSGGSRRSSTSAAETGPWPNRTASR